MHGALQRYLDAASGLGNLTATKAEQLVKQLVRSGEAAGDQMGELVDDLLDRQRKNRESMLVLVRTESVRAVRAMGLATKEEVERLEDRVADLERDVGHLRASVSGGAASPGKKTTKKAAKKAAGKKASKKSGAKKSAAKKATKKTGAKKTGAKKATKKTGAKKTATKKATAKKTAGSS